MVCEGYDKDRDKGTSWSVIATSLLSRAASHTCCLATAPQEPWADSAGGAGAHRWAEQQDSWSRVSPTLPSLLLKEEGAAMRMQYPLVFYPRPLHHQGHSQ